MRHHELGIINRKPPLQWCTKLHYLDSSKTIHSISPINRLQTFPGHFVKQRQSTKYYRHNLHNTNTGNNNNQNNNNNKFHDSNNNSHGAQSSNYLGLKSFDDRYKSQSSREREQLQNNENSILITEPWPSGIGKSKAFAYNNIYNSNNNNNNLGNKLGEKTSNIENGAKLTSLVSFPGSGNTWLRYLLQQATGIHFNIRSYNV